MSGRWFTLTILAICLSLVLFALWRRSHDTARIREFWGADAASIIQSAPRVLIWDGRWSPQQDVPSMDSESRRWQDISGAPGLIHLRATLLDDRYFQWPHREATVLERTARSAAYRVLRFAGPVGLVDVAIDIDNGMVINLASGHAVPIISSSRRAIAAYLDIQIPANEKRN